MAYRFESVISKDYTAGGLVFRAFSEDEISSSFGTLEDCAQTTITVAVEKEGAPVASVDLLAAFWFASEDDLLNRFRSGAYQFDFYDTPDRVAMAAHDWDPQLTGPGDLDDLFGSTPGACYNAMTAAASEVCRELEWTIRGMREEDLIG